jgi:hypothetical protein
MTTCARDHAPIQHDEFYCPLCVVLEDAIDVEQRIDTLQGEVEKANDRLIEAKAADVELIQAERDEARTEAYRIGQLYRRLTFAIHASKYQKTLGKRLGVIDRALLETEREHAQTAA